MSEINTISYLNVLDNYDKKYKEITEKIEKNSLEIECVIEEKKTYCKKILIIRILLIIASIIASVGIFIGLYFLDITSSMSPDDKALFEKSHVEYVLNHIDRYFLPFLVLAAGIMVTLLVTIKKKHNKIPEFEKKSIPFLSEKSKLQDKKEKLLYELESLNVIKSTSSNFLDSLSKIPEFENNEFNLNSMKCYYDKKNYIEYESYRKLEIENYNLN